MRQPESGTLEKINKQTRKRIASPDGKTSRVSLTRLVGEVDRPFLVLVIVMLCIGSVMVFSASYAVSQAKFGGDSYYFARSQLKFAIIGLVAMLLASRLADYRILEKLTYPLHIGALALCVATIIIGVASGGAQRWIEIGSQRFQPSEVLKLTSIMVCAKYISDKPARMTRWITGVAPFFLLMLGEAGILLLQDHLSGAIIIALLIYFMMYLGGARIKPLLINTFVYIPLGVACVPLILKVIPHAEARLKVWSNPFEYLRGDGWQPAQSLYAISSGGFWGLGLGKSIQKHGYLPEPQNDYIFSILCEELGFFGAIIVLILFAILIWRGLYIARRAPTRFSSLLVMGITLKIALHVIFNVLVVTNTFPSTGISLPFFSYGGTSLLMLMGEMGLVLSVSRYSYVSK